MKKILILISFCFWETTIYSQINIVDSLEYILNSKQHDTTKIDCLNKIIFDSASNFPEVILKYSDKAIELSTKLNDSTRLSYSITRRGILYYYLGDYNSALENYFLALGIKGNLGDLNTIWREYNNVGLVLRSSGQYEDALKYFRISLKSIKDKEDKTYEAVILNNIGISLRGLKRLDEAKEVLEKALSINSEIGEMHAMAQNLNNIGNIYKDKKEFQLAINYYKKALKINRKDNDKYEIVQNLNNLAEVSIELDYFDQAKKYLDEAEEILFTIKINQLILENLNIYGKYFTKTENYKLALDNKNKYISMRDSLFFSSRIKQFDQLKTLANAEKEVQKVEFLKELNSVQIEKIKILRAIQFGGGFLILFILALLFIVIRDLKIKRKLNLSLHKHALEEETLNEELKSINEELHAQRNNLEDTLLNLKETQNQLVHSEKMASLGLLASGIAHEINNPLNFIKGGAFGLEQYFNENLQQHKADVQPLIEGINTGIERAANIVKSLNHYNRKSDLIFRECDIHSIIDNCLIILQNQIKKRIDVKKEYTPDKYRLLGQEGKLHQVMLNILSNAVQAIENNGTINIKTVLLHQKIEILISDTGCGISSENISKVFDPFFTTKEPGCGTGLGLSISYNIIDEHNGNIDVKSSLGKGTEFRIELPIFKL